MHNSNAQVDVFGLEIVYRALNKGQEASAKSGGSIMPKDAGADYTIQNHVENGKLETQYISTTKKPKTAEFYAKSNNSTIIAIDTDKLGSSTAIDISDGIDPQTGKPLKGKAFGYATKDLEVLIEGAIPADAYTIHKCK